MHLVASVGYVRVCVCVVCLCVCLRHGHGLGSPMGWLGRVGLGHTVILHRVVYSVNDCLHTVGCYL